MLRTILLAAFTLLSIRGVCQNNKWSFPLHGECSRDYWIDYMVDHDTTSSVRDTRCGALTYDGHKGTDILVRNFKAMDSAVGVYAVADGKVLRVKDGEFDRQKDWSVSG